MISLQSPTLSKRSKHISRRPLRAIDCFCGAGGMSYGLAAAGIQVLGGIDLDRDCQKTYEANLQGASYLNTDVTQLTTATLQKAFKAKADDDRLILVGCSPCQFWSKLNADKTRSKQSAFLLKEFSRFVSDLRPGWVIVENVPGILSKDKSPLPSFLRLLKRLGYHCDHALLDLSHYEIPQTRHRFVLLANRLGLASKLPCATSLEKPLCVGDYIGVANGFPHIPAGHKDLSPFIHTASDLSDLNLRRIRMTPKDGGDRRFWESALEVQAYKHRERQFADVYSRMAWRRPAPTITTRFNSFSNGRFGHPDEDRAISLREGATLQTFPKSF